MSRCFFIVCHESKQKVWIGQGHCHRDPPHAPDMEIFYSGEENTMAALHRFLRTNIGKTLVVLDEDDVYGVLGHYTEFTS